MTLLEITLLILLATILAFVSGKIPFAVISSGIILALILTGVMTPAEAFGGFINTNVVMFVAMFVIGAGLTKTVLIDKAQSLVVRYKDNQRVLIFLSCAAAAFLGAITSATATAAIMIPLLVGIANDIGTSRSKLLYPAMACANIATQMTFMGQGASNMAWNDVMMKAGAPNPLHVWDFTVARIPMLATAILYMTFVGYKLMPDIPNGKFSDGASGQTGSEKISPAKQKLAMIIILATIALMLLENAIGYPHLNVKIGATHAGLSVGEDGASHQCCEDIALMRSIPGMVVLSPADDVEARAAVIAAYNYQGPVYLRFSRLATPVFHDPETYEFQIGKGEKLTDGYDIAVIATGLMTNEALRAAVLAKRQGLNVRVINMPTIKPIDEEIILTAARECGRIITVEEHSVIGGLGEAVCAVVSEKLPCLVHRIGVQDQFGHSGPANEVLRDYGLTAENIVSTIREIVRPENK